MKRFAPVLLAILLLGGAPMLDHQKDWLLSMEETAREHCGVWWRVALAVAAHESHCGISHLATEHNNMHGLAFRKDEIHHKRTHPNSKWRHFDEPEQTWRSFAYLLDGSTLYGHVRLVIGAEKALGASQEEIERAAITTMADPYCKPPNRWRKDVLDWHERICRLFTEREKTEKTDL